MDIWKKMWVGVFSEHSVCAKMFQHGQALKHRKPSHIYSTVKNINMNKYHAFSLYIAELLRFIGEVDWFDGKLLLVITLDIIINFLLVIFVYVARNLQGKIF